jgi:fatty acid desaturase
VKLEYPTLVMIFFCYGLWGVAGVWIWPIFPVLALAIMTVMAALHSSLVHECLHGHPTRSRRLNELLVSVPLSFFYPYRRYKATHLQHHNDERLTDPFEDPESYYRARWCYETAPRAIQFLLRVNNTLVGRLVLGPVFGCLGLLRMEIAHIQKNTRNVRMAWALHFAALAPLMLVIHAMGIPLWLYMITVVWGSLSLISIRTFAEHQWHATPDGRTVVVEHSWLAWLFLNNNLHIVHHHHPQAPWYALPRLYAERREYWQSLNGGYVFRNYWCFLRLYLFQPKEPVVHPIWRQISEPKA